MEKIYCVYIVTNKSNTVLYTGVTSNLIARIQQHREKLFPGFTARCNVSKLVYDEAGYDASGAIAREKQIKAGSGRKKIELINRLNPESRDYTISYSPRSGLLRRYAARNAWPYVIATPDGRPPGRAFRAEAISR